MSHLPPARYLSFALLLSLMVLALTLAQDTKPGTPPVGPLSPREELATFRVPKGFCVELAASEPEVIDPVAMAFDEIGRLYVAEMRGYPNAGVATGEIHSGKIKLLEDRDGDGLYERATVFAEGLRFPTSVLPWNGGLIVTVAPEIIFFRDKDGDGKADEKRTLYTGFGLANIQQCINGLQYGLDNWVYGVAGSNGGTITSPEKPDMPAVELRGRGVRFKPGVPGSLEPTSGGGQFGLAVDEYQRWFVNTNSQHLRHIVLPDHYLRRNPSLAVPAVTLDISDHGASCKVHRISPFESWRVERTKQRKDGPDAQRFSPTELVPGGFVTSGSGPVVYCADLFPKEYHGNTFICDPANNLIHRDVLTPNGVTFTAKRGEIDCEFLASTDTWFRPVNLCLGPDGALYVLDFYREAIETPLSLPDDIKKKMNLETRGKGRIWRIVPESFDRAAFKKKPILVKETSLDLIGHLEAPNLWWRLTAQRLIAERQPKEAELARHLDELAAKSKSAPARVHAMWTLRALDKLGRGRIAKALVDPSPGVREQALRLAEAQLADAFVLDGVRRRAEDDSPGVRFQAAFTLGRAEPRIAVEGLAKIARSDVADPWMQTAILSSAAQTAPALLEELTRDKEFIAKPSESHLQFLTRLSALVGRSAKEEDLARAVRLLSSKGEMKVWQIAVLMGLGQGLQNSKTPLSRLWDQPPPALKETVEQVRPFFDKAATTARDGKRPVADRVTAARFLSYGPFTTAAPALQALLAPQNPVELHLAAVRSLAQHDSVKVADLLLEPWATYGPSLRREVLEAIFARPERLGQLLTAIEKKQVIAGQLEPARLDQLRKHPNAAIRKRAETLLAGQVSPDRKKILDEYQAALDLKADAVKGKAVFKKVCATCHRLENEGVEVGPDLLSALRNKSREQLLTDILDPSREVDPRYINFMVVTKGGRSFTGLIAAETASSLTLRRAEKAEDSILRSDIEVIEATAKSVMPDGLETQLNQQDLADVIAYLQAVAVSK